MTDNGVNNIISSSGNSVSIIGRVEGAILKNEENKNMITRVFVNDVNHSRTRQVDMMLAKLYNKATNKNIQLPTYPISMTIKDGRVNTEVNGNVPVINRSIQPTVVQSQESSPDINQPTVDQTQQPPPITNQPTVVQTQQLPPDTNQPTVVQLQEHSPDINQPASDINQLQPVVINAPPSPIKDNINEIITAVVINAILSNQSKP